ncbi:MAG TPA: hypothetical protein VIS06_07255 [Mycobacteriales bacterium]
MSALGAAMFGALAGGLLAVMLTVLACGLVGRRRVCDYCRDRRGWLIVERSRQDHIAAPSPSRPRSAPAGDRPNRPEPALMSRT